MVDDIDRALLHALHIDGRVPLRRIGEVVGVSAQTVARRYRRLCGNGLRVVGLLDQQESGKTDWFVRLTTTTSSGRTLAQALARRTDTSWVKIVSGGTEILVVMHTDAADISDSPLLQDIPRTSAITGVSAHYVLHRYVGGPKAWGGRLIGLDAQQQSALRPQLAQAPPRQLSAADGALIAALGRDGRAGLAELATATGWSVATVGRRIAELRGAGSLYFDVEFDDELLGAATRAVLWMSVPPAELDSVGRRLAGHEELAFVLATTGRTNLVAQVMCPNPAALHRYLTGRLAELPAIGSVETTPVLATLKAAAAHAPRVDGRPTPSR